jgi:hypothetical protein
MANTMVLVCIKHLIIVPIWDNSKIMSTMAMEYIDVMNILHILNLKMVHLKATESLNLSMAQNTMVN